MAADDVDAYLAALEEPKRATLVRMRSTIRSIIPDAEECISYGMPAFKIRGKAVAGFAAFTNHLSYFPRSSNVLVENAEDVASYTTTKGTLQFAVDKPLPKALIRKLIATRRREAGV